MICFFVIAVFLMLLVNANSSYGIEYFVNAHTGKDTNDGRAAERPWRTIAHVNRIILQPGDSVYFARDSVWEEKLTITSSGTEDRPIVFAAYGDGNNPRIKTSNSYSSWVLHINKGHLKVWKGKIKGVSNTWGAMLKGVRLPRYHKYNSALPVPPDLSDMEEKYFYAPINKGEFYIRNDNENPGPIDVGTRDYAIHVKGSRHVVIDGVDCIGPGGRTDHGKEDRSCLVLVEFSDHVIYKNGILSNHNNCGAVIGTGSTNCRFEGLVSYGHGSTGLYVSTAGPGNKIINCIVANCGNLSTDFGDMGLIGVWNSPGVVIEGCFLHDNAHAGAQKVDAVVSFVQSPNGLVKRCHVKNAAGTAIQFAENSDNGSAEYNIIDRWAVYGSRNSNEGIRIGGGRSTSSARGCRIFNNLFINGGTSPGEWAALRILDRENDGLQVKNNIFHNNQGIYEIMADSRDGYKNWAFSNNLFYRTGGIAIKYGGRIYDHSHIIGKIKGYYSYDQRQEKDSIVGNPGLLGNLTGLEPSSPCIGRGTDAGLSRDFYNNPVPGKTGINIGPFQK